MTSLTTTSENIKNYLESQKNLIETHLHTLIKDPSPSHGKLFEAARYSLLDAGKRIRPILTLAAAELFTQDPHPHPQLALTPACAIEMVHTYSMIHDDLPCMDDDDFRRGKPSLHKQYNEGHAVLTGDYLLTLAFEILATAPGLSAEQRIDLVKALAEGSGGHGMIGGQILDIEAENRDISLEALQNIHYRKTAALFSASLEMGGIAGEATPEQLDYLRRFGKMLGLAFQITDDILDVTNSKEKHGKTLSSDVANSKATYVSLLGVEAARQQAQQLLMNSLGVLRKLPGNTQRIAQISRFVVSR